MAQQESVPASKFDDPGLFPRHGVEGERELTLSSYPHLHL